MNKDPENLKVIFFEPGADSKQGVIVSSGYFSFVPTFKQGDSINITLARAEAKDAVVHDPIGHKTHQITATDWVVMVDETSREALATLIVSVAKLVDIAQPVDTLVTYS